MPIFKLLEGRPKRVFFSAAAAFLGGILFFRCPCVGVVEEKDLAEEQERRRKDRCGYGRKSTEERGWAITLFARGQSDHISLPIDFDFDLPSPNT